MPTMPITPPEPMWWYNIACGWLPAYVFHHRTRIIIIFRRRGLEIANFRTMPAVRFRTRFPSEYGKDIPDYDPFNRR